MTLKQKREKLIAELLKVKDEGLRVFVCNSDYYAYGIMTDGINIVYVQFYDYGTGFYPSFEYIPSYKKRYFL